MTDQERIERFWDNVDKNSGQGPTKDCWIWKAGKISTGYGALYIGKQILAHRLSWILKYGEIPKGLFVLHLCDNPPCVNPDHLFLGRQKENVADMMKKKRNGWNKSPICGEDHPDAKLNKNQVIEIRHFCKEGTTSLAEIGRRFGITRQSVRAIKLKRSWKHIGV